MKCNRKKPESCFNCTLPECIENEGITEEENEAMMCADLPTGKPATVNRSPESMKRRREKSKEWNRKHYKEQREKRKEYFKNYYLRRKDYFRNYYLQRKETGSCCAN